MFINCGLTAEPSVILRIFWRTGGDGEEAVVAVRFGFHAATWYNLKH